MRQILTLQILKITDILVHNIITLAIILDRQIKFALLKVNVPNIVPNNPHRLCIIYFLKQIVSIRIIDQHIIIIQMVLEIVVIQKPIQLSQFPKTLLNQIELLSVQTLVYFYFLFVISVRNVQQVLLQIIKRIGKSLYPDIKNNQGHNRRTDKNDNHIIQRPIIIAANILGLVSHSCNRNIFFVVEYDLVHQPFVRHNRSIQRLRNVLLNISLVPILMIFLHNITFSNSVIVPIELDNRFQHFTTFTIQPALFHIILTVGHIQIYIISFLILQHIHIIIYHLFINHHLFHLLDLRVLVDDHQLDRI